MAKDYMQDILPKDEPSRPAKKIAIQGDEVVVPSDTMPQNTEPEIPPERSIRNINVNRQRPLSAPPPRPPGREMQPLGSGMPRKKGIFSSMWLWITVAVLLVVFVVLALFMFRQTSVTVIPRAHTIVFDNTKTFTAYPASSAASGSLTYTSLNLDVDDSQSVASNGSQHAERKASGSVTVVNEFSSAPVKLVKSTRFQTPDGLVFRAPVDISVPGMKNGTPGSVTVTIVADQAGQNYNVGPTARFTLPGLKGGAMYDKVYAKSSTAFAGGFLGDEPNVAQATRDAAISEMQGRMRDKILAAINSQIPADGTTFPTFAYVTFQEMPATAGAATGQTTLNLRAHIIVPVFPTEALNRTIGGTVSADAANADLTLLPKDGFGANIVGTTTAYGTLPITFSFSGNAQLVWNVDSAALTSALAGKDQNAFQTVVNGFPGVQEARARIEPFWQHTFPSDPTKIQVVLAEPQEPKSQ